MLKTSRDWNVGEGAVWFIVTNEKPHPWPLDGQRKDVRGSLVVAIRGRCEMTWEDFFLLLFLGLETLSPYQVSLAHNILPWENECLRGRGWCKKLMEDVTNHKIYDKSMVWSNHANNFECVCDKYKLSLQHEDPGPTMQSYSFDNLPSCSIV